MEGTSLKTINNSLLQLARQGSRTACSTLCSQSYYAPRAHSCKNQTITLDIQQAVSVMASLADLYIQISISDKRHVISSVSAVGTIIVIP